MPKTSTKFDQITPSEFFYRNRDLAGFSNPAKALYTATRELVENSLDACESSGILPKINVRLIPTSDDDSKTDPRNYLLRVIDNGPGIDSKQAPYAFGRVFYGSKYSLRQARGMFGMGGTMAVLYGQITTSKPVSLITSTNGKDFHKFSILIDIQNNSPIVVDKDVIQHDGSSGTSIEIKLEGDALRSSSKLHDYFRQTALVTPYAEISFLDPHGRFWFYSQSTNQMPKPPGETKPHPHGFDFEAMRRLIGSSDDQTLQKLLMNNFHRVGPTTALNFSKFVGIDPNSNPKDLSNSEIVNVVDYLHKFDSFLPPDSNCLSPLGSDILNAGIMNELNPEFSTITIRPPSAYSGFPFIIEVGLAYGGKVSRNGISLFRFANRIPLLYDEGSDVAWQVVKEIIDRKNYKIPDNAPLAIITHMCSTKIPYKSVGKEFIGERPEVERELKNGVREVMRQLRMYLSRKGSAEAVKRRQNIYLKYLPLIAEFSKELSGAKKLPKYESLMKKYSNSDNTNEEADINA